MGDVIRPGNWTPSNGSDDTGSGNPPGGGDVEQRVSALEKAIPDIQIRLVKLDSRMDAIENHMATKADLHEMAAALHKAMNEQTWKFLAGATGMAALFSAIAFGLARALG